MKLTIDLKALEGDKVRVLNYKKKPAIWESGVVTLVEIRVNSKRELNATYRVMLDRKSNTRSFRSRRNGIVLYVGEDRIEQLNNDFPGLSQETFNITLGSSQDVVNVKAIITSDLEKDFEGNYKYNVREI